MEVDRLMNTRNILVLTLVAGLALGLGACDDDDDGAAANNGAMNNDVNNATNNDVSNNDTDNNATNNASNNDAGACTTNKECFDADGAGSICGDGGTCQSALSAECAAPYGAWDEENLLIVGSILPTSGDFATIGIPIQNAVQMAIDEFAANGGVGGDYNLVTLGCDSEGSADRGVAAATHLAAIGSPAIVGPAFSGIYLEVVTMVTANAGVMTMSPSATSATITSLDDNGLAWRTAPSDAFQGVAMSQRVLDIRAAAGGDLKVIVFGKGDAYGTGLVDVVTTTLGPEIGADNFLGSIYNDPGGEDPANIPEKVASALSDATGIPDPDVVMLAGTNEVFEILDLIEASVADGDLERPIYMISDGGKLPEAVTAAMADPTLVDFIEIVTPAGENGAVYDGYNDRFNAAFGGDAGVYSANAYDAAYLIGLGLCGVIGNGDDPTGGNIASAMANVVEGTPIAARPSNIADACTSLAGGGKIDYDGASGPLDFDLSTGEAPANAVLFDIWEKRPGEFEFREIGEYTPTTGMWNITQ